MKNRISFFFFLSSRRLHTIWPRDWSSDVCSSDLERLARLCGRRVRVPARHDDAALAQEVDELERAGQLRRQRHVAHMPGCQQTLQQRPIRIAPRLRRVRAETLLRDERP